MSTALQPYEAQDDQPRALVPAAPAIVMPLVDVKSAQAAIEAFEKLKRAIVRPSDVQDYKGHKHLKKSFWRRAANFFGVSAVFVSERRFAEDDGTVRYEVIYRATAPNGQFMDGDGACTTTEKTDRSGRVIVNSEHNTRATAHTRAKNRAISDLIGGGEVTAEELPDEDEVYNTARTQQVTRQTQPRATAPKPASNGSTNGALNWGKLRLDARNKRDIKSQGQWEDALERVFGEGVRDTAGLTAEHYAQMRRYIETGELPAPQDETVVDADPAASDPHDLARLDLSNGRH